MMVQWNIKRRRTNTPPLLLIITAVAVTDIILCGVNAFVPSSTTTLLPVRPILSNSCDYGNSILYAKKKTQRSSSSGGGGFGASSPSKQTKKKKSNSSSGRGNLISALNDDDTNKKKKENKQTFVKSDQEKLLNELAIKSESTIIGQAVSKCPEYNTPNMDPFWQLLPSLISTKFPTARDDELSRVANMIEFSLGVRGPEENVIVDKWRPHTELHAYMSGLGDTTPFLDTDQLELCSLLSENYDVITEEYEALLEERFDRKGNDRFQSVTSMNCKLLFFSICMLFYDVCIYVYT